MTLTQMANMFLTFAIVLNSEFGRESVTSYALNAIYLTITAIQFIYALGNDPRDNKEVYQICYIFYGTLFLFTMFCCFLNLSLTASNVLHDVPHVLTLSFASPLVRRLASSLSRHVVRLLVCCAALKRSFRPWKRN